MYPEEFGPPGRKRVHLPGRDKPVLITQFSPRFERWSERLHGTKPMKLNERGDLVPDDYGGKPFLWVDGRAKFAELAIVHYLKKAGWGAVWVHHPTGGRYCDDWPLEQGRVSTLPGHAESPGAPPEKGSPAEMMEILRATCGGAGLPDIFAWKDRRFLLVESKNKAAKEGFTRDQLLWMSCLVNAGMSPELLAETIAVVEWTFKPAEAHG